MDILRVKNLTKKFSHEDGIYNLSFNIKQGQLVGLIGPNGAGKTTALRCILNLIRPDTGRVDVEGYDLTGNDSRAKARVSYIPEMPSLYDDLTVLEHLKFIAMAYGVAPDTAKQRWESLLHRFELWDKRNDIPTNFSKGMKQKVMIACSLVHDASVFLVDEPFMGLDPRASKLFKDILIRLKNKNKGILMATHILDTAEKLCDEYILLYKGSIRAMGTIEQLQEASVLGPHASLEDIFIKLTEDRS